MSCKWIAASFVLLQAPMTLAEEPRFEAQNPRTPSYYFSMYGGHSITVLGSEDPRLGFGLGFGYGRYEPRFHLHGIRGELVWEGYYEHSSSGGASGRGPNQTEAIGILAYARYRWPKYRGAGFYAAIGWGLQYANQPTVDLDSKFNSTPMAGIGVSWDTGNGEGSLGIRLLHISNAGVVGDNQGQNQLFLVYTWRF